MSPPRKGDNVWVEGRKPQPNGRVHVILYQDDRDVIVRFFENGGEEVYSWESFDRFNPVTNQWELKQI
jgi:hypothetical protein